MNALQVLFLSVITVAGFLCLGLLWKTGEVNRWMKRWIVVEHQLARLEGREPRDINKLTGDADSAPTGTTLPPSLRLAALSCGTLVEKYNELLMAVQKKCPGETRHETALRYIRQAEELTGGAKTLAAAEGRRVFNQWSETCRKIVEEKQ